MDSPRSIASTFMRRVKLKNYKSIAACSVELAPLTILVGRNASGKSNFLDALRFLSHSLQTSLDHAIRERGGLDSVRRRSHGHPHNFGIEVELAMPNDTVVHYGINVGVKGRGQFSVTREKLEVVDARTGRPAIPIGQMNQTTVPGVHDGHVGGYEVNNGEVISASLPNMPVASADRLYLVTASGHAVFRPAYDALSSMGFYNLNPEEMKRPQSPDAGELLHRDGSNISSVIARIGSESPELKGRVGEYLSRIVPGVVDFSRKELGSFETVQFRQVVQGSKDPWTFNSNEMSDGTLRALGTLVAVAQFSRRDRVRLVGIEEPETALHPAAAAALMDALREASEHTQVIVTTHSAELLDQLDLGRDQLLVVQSRNGTTEIGRIDGASVEAVSNQLSSPGELLELDQLEPDESHLDEQRQMRLFQFSA